MLQTIKRIFNYLANLEWTERPQKDCKFCAIKPENIIFENDLCKAVKNIKEAGEAHWLIMPKKHIRDIENLSSAHLELCGLHHADLTSV
ncbi:uncharacterized protein Triagg1_3998 [Trichoderma aggressivum f. europaeum]|uniref:HIT domain-containing protein n=1 Tax=Trichoderma aggressivum f. europaeum TaxID=173218 RepID=A0AAE1IFC8_9HYPO|nr:hypothetical protein Triagg1_3998 [Trichoderma aggressivum f. europaeum]